MLSQQSGLVQQLHVSQLKHRVATSRASAYAWLRITKQLQAFCFWSVFFVVECLRCGDIEAATLCNPMITARTESSLRPRQSDWCISVKWIHAADEPESNSHCAELWFMDDGCPERLWAFSWPEMPILARILRVLEWGASFQSDLADYNTQVEHW